MLGLESVQSGSLPPSPCPIPRELLTGVQEADGWEGGQVLASGDFLLLEPTREAAQEVFALLVEAQPQVDLHLGLDCPASRAKPPLPGELRNGRVHMDIGNMDRPLLEHPTSLNTVLLFLKPNDPLGSCSGSCIALFPLWFPFPKPEIPWISSWIKHLFPNISHLADRVRSVQSVPP